MCVREENIPVDGVIIQGSSAVNESALTGESIPVDKETGDQVSAATINQSGFIKCEATRVGEDTTLSQIIQMVSDAAATKAPIAKVADRYRGYLCRQSSAIAIVTIIVWLLAGQTIGFCTGKRDLGTGHKLPMRSGTCDPGCHYGGQWYGRQKRHTFQKCPYPLKKPDGPR